LSVIKKLRIGSVPYLNAQPLVRYLPPGLLLREPSLLAQEFRQGFFDVALIPVVECFLEKNIRIIDGLAIACRGSVHSVIVAHKKQIKDLKSISLDAASLTSVTLLKVLLKKHWKINPDLVPEGIEAEGQLLIGDRALKFREKFPQAQVSDLGLIWRNYTGLPFVFAVWALHPQCVLSAEQVDCFRELSLKGLSARSSMIQTPGMHQYLFEFIRYEMGDLEKEAIHRFILELRSLEIFPELVGTAPEYV